MKLREVLGNPEALSTPCWLYLPWRQAWHLESDALVMGEQEAKAQDEADPDGTPQEAKRRGMRRALEIATVQAIVANAREQKPRATEEDLLRALFYFVNHDAFLKF